VPREHHLYHTTDGASAEKCWQRHIHTLPTPVIKYREKVEIETLTDAQIARLLNVGTSTVSHWCNKFHIKPADKCKQKFKEKYGSDPLELRFKGSG
jgi:DNA-binding transcriptional regulator YiaG